VGTAKLQTPDRGKERAMRVKTNNVEWMSGTQTVEKVAAQLCGGRDFTWQASINGVEIDTQNLKTVEDATDEVAAAMAAGDWYWLDGSAYCPACVECESPAIDAADQNVQRGGAVSVCSCCRTDYQA
jgi:hypothetical protein